MTSVGLARPRPPGKALDPIDYSQVRPLHNHVLVQWLPAPEMQGSIVIPDQARHPQYKVPPREGIVIAVGPGEWIGKWNPNHTRLLSSDYTRREEIPLSPGDRILFNRSEANVIDPERHIVMLRYPQHILAVVEEGTYAPVPRRQRVKSRFKHV